MGSIKTRRSHPKLHQVTFETAPAYTPQGRSHYDMEPPKNQGEGSSRCRSGFTRTRRHILTETKLSVIGFFQGSLQMDMQPRTYEATGTQTAPSRQ